MSSDVPVVVSNDAVLNLLTVTKAEVTANQAALAVADEEHDDALPGASRASSEDESLYDAELADEDKAGGNTSSDLASAKNESPVEEPYDFDHCTVQIGLQLLPDDGDPAGRPVVVGVRNHADAPIVALTRLSTLGPLPQVVTELLDRLRADLPVRQRASEEAAARKKAEDEAARARREAARSKSRASNAKPAPKKVNPLDQAPESGPTPSSAPAVTAPTFDAPKASEQISLF